MDWEAGGGGGEGDGEGDGGGVVIEEDWGMEVSADIGADVEGGE